MDMLIPTHKREKKKKKKKKKSQKNQKKTFFLLRFWRTTHRHLLERSQVAELAEHVRIRENAVHVRRGVLRNEHGLRRRRQARVRRLALAQRWWHVGHCVAIWLSVPDRHREREKRTQTSSCFFEK
jgi:hypothetical protein